MKPVNAILLFLLLSMISCGGDDSTPTPSAETYGDGFSCRDVRIRRDEYTNSSSCSAVLSLKKKASLVTISDCKQQIRSLLNDFDTMCTDIDLKKSLGQDLVEIESLLM
ncbi:hypothetical protein [Halobacteriovorax sp. ZH2_bin.1]|uniref:hypothetical protein n=1 Tax=unclassified Halobacteriovorax TaxID=2639665 RepID=UPI00371A042A